MSEGAADKAAIQQVSEGDALTSPAVSIVWFGHVVMPELATGNGASTARCIRPGGRRDSALMVSTAGGPNMYGSLKVNEWLQPREHLPHIHLKRTKGGSVAIVGFR